MFPSSVLCERLLLLAAWHERFTAIDSVENNGLDFVGAFHSDKWGDFRTYFKFQLSPTGKIKRLDIGQAK